MTIHFVLGAVLLIFAVGAARLWWNRRITRRQATERFDTLGNVGYASANVGALIASEHRRQAGVAYAPAPDPPAEPDLVDNLIDVGVGLAVDAALTDSDSSADAAPDSSGSDDYTGGGGEFGGGGASGDW